MTTILTAKIEGMDQLVAKLQRLGEAAAGEKLRQAGMAGAVPIMNGAKNSAPKLTRTLSRSITREVLESTATRVEIGIGTDVEYAAIQEFGGTIVPKGKQYLAVPLTDEARRYANASGFPGLKPRFGRGGQSGALVDDSGVAQYALVKSVTIPAQPYLRPALDQNRNAAKNEIREVLRLVIQRAAE